MSAEEEETDALANLSAFKRDVLWVLASKGELNGLETKRTLEDYYDEPVNHGRLYPNLDDLVDAGLIEKGEFDGRTNCYSLTEDGRRALSERQAWQGPNVGDEDGDAEKGAVADGGQDGSGDSA